MKSSGYPDISGQPWVGNRIFVSSLDRARGESPKSQKSLKKLALIKEGDNWNYEIISAFLIKVSLLVLLSCMKTWKIDTLWTVTAREKIKKALEFRWKGVQGYDKIT